VRRQGDLLHANGFRVCGVGIPGALSELPAWPVFEARELAPGSGAQQCGGPAPVHQRDDVRRHLRAAREAALTAGILLPSLGRIISIARLPARFALAQASRWHAKIALADYWGRPRIAALLEAARQAPGKHFLANDWTALPIAARLAAERGGRFGYDTHEFASQEYADRPSWRLLHRPLVRAIEGRFIREAAFVSAVSDGIALGLRAEYGLAQTPWVIRNLPRFEALPYCAPGDRLEVLYHGILAGNRGIEPTIESVCSWRPEFRLTLRGPGEAAFLERLRRRVAALNLEERVSIVPPVAMTDLISRAHAFDIGIFALPSSSAQNVYALPNKLFEYVMAGLTLCVTDLPEMASIVRGHGLGRLIPSADPAAIAAAVNGFDRESVAAYKRRSLDAARVLCWEEEGKRLLAACDVFRDTPSGAVG